MTDRRTFVRNSIAVISGLVAARRSVLAAEVQSQGGSSASLFTDDFVEAEQRFPYFQSTPVSYRNVKMQDTFWAPRQRVTREVTIPWITKARDSAGGLEAFKLHSGGYVAGGKVVNMEAIKLIEAMATVVGLQPDSDIEGLISAWVKPVFLAQGADGYLQENFPPGLDHPALRWQAVWWSHEAYTTGHYIESAIAYREATGNEVMYESAVRAADNMVTELLGSDRAYTSGHPEIEQALMRLYGQTGQTKYLQLCGWFLNQRGHHKGRQSFGRMRQDDIPVNEQRTIEGHAVMAGFLYNGVTHYVGATGDTAYREAVLSVWDDFANRKMYLHGAGGNLSSRVEGYRKNPYCILPDDTYGESCSVFANFQWAHSLSRLTGDAQYINVAERMLYNAFYASLSLKGDACFYRNVSQVDEPTPRSPELAGSCCPPNIVKLFNKVGEFFYSTDAGGIYVNHYGAASADIPWNDGVQLTQRTEYPWDGKITLLVEPKSPRVFALRLRAPDWAKSYTLSVNGKPLKATPKSGWLVVQRLWKTGDEVNLNLRMDIERVTMPPQFKEYENRAALRRGPIVYCLEQQDVEMDPTVESNAAIGPFRGLATLYIPDDAKFEAQHRAELLGGVTVLQGEICQLNLENDSERRLRVTFIPYGVWNNRTPGAMRIWLGARKVPLVEMLLPEQGLGESCVG